MSTRWSVLACTVLFLGVFSRPARADPPAPTSPNVSSPAPVVVDCRVEGRSTIRFLLPAGRHVAQGELICELDPSDVQSRLGQGTLELRRLDAALASARLSREAAELSVSEGQAEHGQQRSALRNAITLAEKGLELARAAHDEAARRPGSDEEASAQREVQKAGRTLEQARSSLAVFDKQTVTERTAALTDAVAAAKTTERTAAEARAEAETALGRLQQQLRDCRVVAPVAGTLLYVRPPGTLDEGQYVVLSKGVTVHERQPLFRIVPDRPGPARSGPSRPIDNGAGRG